MEEFPSTSIYSILIFPSIGIWYVPRITSRTKMIVINTPHNPSGSVLEETDLKELSQLL